MDCAAQADGLIRNDCRSAAVAELAALLQGESSLNLMVGAGVSGVEPTRLPDAVSWVVGLLSLLVRQLEDDSGAGFAGLLERAGLQLGELGAALTYGGRLATPLEAILQAINDVEDGLGDRLAAAVDSGRRPVNDLHRLAAGALAQGAIVVTTNFDTCIERAYEDLVGRSCPRMVRGVGEAAGEARLIKVHGSADLPQTLRHTLRTVNQELDSVLAAAVGSAWRRETVVLGWAGADFDVLRAIRPHETGGPLWWLDRLPFDDAVTRRIGWQRRVNEVQGDFAGLMSHMEGEGIYAANWDTIAGESERLVAQLSFESAYRVISTIIYQAAVAEARLKPYVDALVAFTSVHRARLGAPALHGLQGAWNQHAGGRQLLRGASHLALSRPVPPFRNIVFSLSDVIEQLERLLAGFFIPARALGLGVHAAALVLIRRLPPDRATTLGRLGPTLLWQRLARSAAGVGLRRLERRWLDRALASSDGDPWHEINLRKRLALAKARAGDSTWPEELAKARECCEFAGRRQELADTYRAEAACFWFTGSSSAVELALSRSDAVGAPGSSSAGWRRNRLFRRILLRLPRPVSRIILWFT